MDPNANLREQDELTRQQDATGGKLHNYDRYRLYDLRVALRDWLKAGGFAPNWDKYPSGTLTFRKWASACGSSKAKAM